MYSLFSRLTFYNCLSTVCDGPERKFLRDPHPILGNPVKVEMHVISIFMRIWNE